MVDSRVIEMVGKKFGRLIVLERVEDGKSYKRRFRCKCDCGKETICAGPNLRNGHTASCGCLHKEMTGNKSRTHGKTGSPEYSSWRSMISRCTLESGDTNKSYISRGIVVCDRWRDSFENFYADMGPRPSMKHTIERLNNNGNYEPSNCKWATPIEQANNKRNTIFVEYRGKTMSFMDAVRLSGTSVHFHTIKNRLHLGWSVDRAIDAPLRGSHRG